MKVHNKFVGQNGTEDNKAKFSNLSLMGGQLVLRGTRGPRTSCPRGTCGPRTSCPGGQLVLGPHVQGDNLTGGHPILGHRHNFPKKPGHDIFQAGPKLSVAFFGIKSPEASCLLKVKIFLGWAFLQTPQIMAPQTWPEMCFLAEYAVIFPLSC